MNYWGAGRYRACVSYVIYHAIKHLLAGAAQSTSKGVQGMPFLHTAHWLTSVLSLCRPRREGEAFQLVLVETVRDPSVRNLFPHISSHWLEPSCQEEERPSPEHCQAGRAALCSHWSSGQTLTRREGGRGEVWLFGAPTSAGAWVQSTLRTLGRIGPG